MADSSSRREGPGAADGETSMKILSAASSERPAAMRRISGRMEICALGPAALFAAATRSLVMS